MSKIHLFNPKESCSKEMADVVTGSADKTIKMTIDQARNIIKEYKERIGDAIIEKEVKTHEVNLDELVPNPYNRALNPDSIKETHENIKSSGVIKPVIYVELDPHTLRRPFHGEKKPLKMIIDGHHRVEALKQMGHKTAPAVKATNGILTSDELKEKEVETKTKAVESVTKSEDVEKFIRHEGSKWTVHAESGKSLGSYGTKEEAITRLRQIEYFKHKKFDDQKDLVKYIVTTFSPVKKGVVDVLRTAVSSLAPKWPTVSKIPMSKNIMAREAVHLEEKYRTLAQRVVDAAAKKASNTGDISKKSFSTEEVRAAGDKLNVDWNKVNLDQLVMGANVELEHSDVTGGNLDESIKIALAHLDELPDYYTKLEEMELEAKKDAASSAINPRELGKDKLKKEIKKYFIKQIDEVRVKQPTEEMAQPNTEGSQEKVNDIETELQGLQAALKQIESIARQEGTLTEQELTQIVIPLQQSVEILLEALQSSTDYKESDEEETEPSDEESQPEDKVNDPWRPVRKPNSGPERQVGTAERELQHPTTTFAPNDKNTEQNDIEKEIRVIGGTGKGKGFHGDPSRHAEAARERWEMEGVPPGGKPKVRKPRTQVVPEEQKEGVSVLPKAVKEMAAKTAGRAGRSMARIAGDTIAEIGMQAFGAVVGLIVFRYLAGESTSMKALLGVGKAGVQQAVVDSFKYKRVTQLAAKHPAFEVIRQWAVSGMKKEAEVKAELLGQRILSAGAAKAAATTAAADAMAEATGKKAAAVAAARQAMKDAAAKAAKKAKK